RRGFRKSKIVAMDGGGLFVASQDERDGAAERGQHTVGIGEVRPFYDAGQETGLAQITPPWCTSTTPISSRICASATARTRSTPTRPTCCSR
ncbi:unnamed protein product, partial [Prorocentrum cordatum]